MKILLFSIALTCFSSIVDRNTLSFIPLPSGSVENQDTNIVRNDDYPQAQIRPTPPRSGEWYGNLIPSGDRSTYSIYFKYSVEWPTNSVTGWVNIYRNDKRYEKINISLRLQGKVFEDSLYLTGDTVYTKYSEWGESKALYKSTVFRHFRFFTKCYLKTEGGSLTRFMQGVFIDSAQFKEGEGSRGHKYPSYGVFLARQSS